ncbi:MAG: MotA/TolQ/ExbB proton channel family protein [Treponema sp.]|nr:MotA/TolQ/ExbB proton channel family protein [Candidatus Treponema caballi]
MIEVLKSGGILMIPIIICGVIATFIIIERIIYYSGISRTDKRMYAQLNPLLEKRYFEEALAVCRTADTPASNVIGKILQFHDCSEEDIKDAAATEANRQLPDIDRYLTTLGTIANISTLLGLLGTVTGNIKAFGVLGAGGSMGNPAVLAGSIAEALVTTASGLVVSIPSVIFHNFFVARSERIIGEIESCATDTVLTICGGKRV